jgi:hypothetical protein
MIGAAGGGTPPRPTVAADLSLARPCQEARRLSAAQRARSGPSVRSSFGVATGGPEVASGIVDVSIALRGARPG